MCVSYSNARCEGKVDLVCDAILKCLDDLGGGSTYLLATITALVKKTTPELETVLVKIKQLQGELQSLVFSSVIVEGLELFFLSVTIVIMFQLLGQ